MVLRQRGREGDRKGEREGCLDGCEEIVVLAVCVWWSLEVSGGLGRAGLESRGFSKVLVVNILRVATRSAGKVLDKITQVRSIYVVRLKLRIRKGVR